MREVKFRYVFKNTKTGKILYRFYSLDDLEIVKMPSLCEQHGSELISRDQFIGSQDINEKDIHNGDIVKFEHYDNLTMDDNGNNIFSEDAQISIIEEKGIFQGDFADWGIWLIDWAMDADYIFEIIGNKHENPDLLETPPY